MTYEFTCPACRRAFDVTCSVKDATDVMPCSCGGIAERKPYPSRLYLNGTKVQHAEYNPGLGQVVKNAQHRREICKARGLEEIGSEPAEKIHKHYDERRAEKLESAYDEATKGWVGDGSS